jgi:ubiquitin-conjugating enzyme E2 O
MASLTDKNQTKNKSKEKQNKITRSIKRLLCDFKHYMDTKPDLTYVSICNDNAHLVKVLIFGPEGTPYHNGNFFIDLKFPNDYPYNPPKANFLTTDGRIRFNPNLYATGKVCLSILGTWSGPSWSIVQRLSSVILSIQSLLGEHPLRNEPGYENSKVNEPKMIGYNNYVQFHTINYSIINMIKNKLYPPEFEYVVIKHFFDNYDSIIKKVNELLVLDDKIASTTYLSLKAKLEYKKCKEELVSLHKYAEEYLSKTKETLDELKETDYDGKTFKVL